MLHSSTKFELIQKNNVMRFRKIHFIFSWHICIVFFWFVSCKKDKQPETPPVSNPVLEVIQGINFSIGYTVDSLSFVSNSFNYNTLAGYNYSITNLSYYLSKISLIKADSTCVLLNEYLFVDALSASTNQLLVKNIPAGNYIGLKFNIGLDSLHNISDTLPATIENINMQWPVIMGGGYHFLKLEGYYKDSTGTYGYAMHLGTTNCLIPIKIIKPITILANTATSVHLVMNINEWFKNPHTYNFNVDGNYIMGNAINMKKIADNGVDVFNF